MLGKRAIRLARILLPPVVLALALPASAEAVWSAPVTLSPSGHSAYYPQVGVDQDGNAVFVWRRPDGTTDCGGIRPGCYRVEVGARSATGTLSTVQTVSPAGQDTEPVPQLAVDQGGNAVVTWQAFDGTSDCGGSPCYGIQTRARSAAGSLSATQTVSSAGQHSVDPEVAVDQDGDAVLVWAGNSVDCRGFPCDGIQTRTRSAATPTAMYSKTRG